MDIQMRRLWNEEDLLSSFHCNKVVARKMNLRGASLRYNIPKSTLSDKITSLKSRKEIILKPQLGAFTTTCAFENENQLSKFYKLLVKDKENNKRVKEQNKNLKSNFKKTNRAKKIKKTRAGKAVIINKETLCVVCLETNDEDWIQCSECQEWTDEACADMPECSDDYICDHCK